MPRIHEIIAEVPGYNPPGVGGVPIFRPAASPAAENVGAAETLGKVSSALTDQFVKLRQAELTVEGEQRSSAAEVEAAQAEEDLKHPTDGSAVNPDTFVQDYRKKLSEIYSRHFGQITDSQVATAFQLKFGEFAKGRLIQAYRDQVGMRVDRVKAGSEEFMQQMEITAGTASSDEYAYLLVGQMRGWWKKMTDLGVYTAADAETRRQQGEARVFESRARAWIDRDPMAFTQAERVGTLPDYFNTFSLKERNTLSEYADRKSNEFNREADRRAKQIEDEQKHQDNVQITDLAIRAIRGQLKPGELDQARLYNKTLSGDKTTALELENLAQNPVKEGGITNWGLYNQLWDQAIVGKLQVADVLRYRGAGLGRTEVQKLVDLIQKTEDRTIFDNDYFKQGTEELKNQLLPKGAIVDEARQKRYAAAYGEFVDRATPFIREGKAPEAINLARDIVNRYASTQITPIPPAFVPRYKTKEETVKAFERGEMSRNEFNRQIWMIDELHPPEPLGPPVPENLKPRETSRKKSFSPF